MFGSSDSEDSDETGYTIELKRHPERDAHKKPSARKTRHPKYVRKMVSVKQKNLKEIMDRFESNTGVVKKVDFGFDLYMLLDRYDATLEEKVRQLYSTSGKMQYFMTNLYVFFLAICKDLDFMSWILIMNIGFRTDDTAILMMLVWSILGWTIGFAWFAWKSYKVYYGIEDLEEAYRKALKLHQQNNAQLLTVPDLVKGWIEISKKQDKSISQQNSRSRQRGRRNEPENELEIELEKLARLGDEEIEYKKKRMKEIRADIERQLKNPIMMYKLTYGDLDGRKVYTVPQWFNIIPMFGVMTLLNFYIQENHEEQVSRLFRASALRTLILVNTWSTVSITIPVTFVICWRFTYGGASISEADMFSYFSMAQAILSICLTFTAMGMPGFEDTVVRILKDADEISSEKALAQTDNRAMYAYFRKWHKQLTFLVSHFRVAEIGIKKGNRGVINFPTIPTDIDKYVWTERLSPNWVLGLMARCEQLGRDLDYLPDESGNIYQEKALYDAIMQVRDEYWRTESEGIDVDYAFWRKVAQLYAISTVLLTDAADKVLTCKTLLALEKDPIESKVESSFLKLRRAAEFETPLNYLQKSYHTKLKTGKKKKNAKGEDTDEGDIDPKRRWGKKKALSSSSQETDVESPAIGGDEVLDDEVLDDEFDEEAGMQ